MIELTKKALIFFSICVYTAYAQQCSNVAGYPTQVVYDPSCAQGGLGCGAGGQQNCRFCGFDIFPPCPTTAAPTTTTTGTTGPTTTRTTVTTTPRSTTTKDPNATGGGGNCECVGGGSQINFVDPDDDDPNLIFFDDFKTFNFDIWKHDLTMSGGGNWEFQLYHNNRTNSYVTSQDGPSRLVIKPTLTADRIGENDLRQNYRLDMWGGSPVDQCTGNNFYGCERTSGAGGNILNPIQSAKLTTVQSFKFKYGRFEARAKLPEGDWLWPAIWLLPARNQYGMWPASGEIDIMESRGNNGYPDSAGGGVESFGSTLHWGADWTQNRFEKTSVVHKHTGKLSNDFHIYGLVWTEDRLYTYFDDESNIVLDVDMTKQSFWEFGQFASVYENPWKEANINAPFDQEFYIIINLAVGGTAGYFKDGIGGKPWTDKSSNSVNEFYAAKSNWYNTWKTSPTLEVDYIKIWKLD